MSKGRRAARRVPSAKSVLLGEGDVQEVVVVSVLTVQCGEGDARRHHGAVDEVDEGVCGIHLQAVPEGAAQLAEGQAVGHAEAQLLVCPHAAPEEGRNTRWHRVTGRGTLMYRQGRSGTEGRGGEGACCFQSRCGDDWRRVDRD